MISTQDAPRRGRWLAFAAAMTAAVMDLLDSTDTQVAAPATSQRLELAITTAEDLLSRDAREAHGGDSCDLLRQACAEIAQAARDYLRATQLAERGSSAASPSGGSTWETRPGSGSSPRS